MDRSEEFRSAAAECLALWFDWADGQRGAESLESILREFNDERMIPQ
jgi:hypothetical protein